MENSEKATFAGGCFWCMVKPFDEIDGIISIKSGYTGGHVENPTYEEVCSDETGHSEAVQIVYDPEIMTYSELLDIYWPLIDPTDSGGQFHNRGVSYQTAIYYHNLKQKQLAEQSKQELAEKGIFKEPIVTPIKEATIFYEAEEYHQDFYKKDPEHYQAYRLKSGRDSFKENHWREE